MLIWLIWTSYLFNYACGYVRTYYVCMHVYMYVCMYACMHVCMHVCMYVYMYVLMQAYVSVYLCVCVSLSSVTNPCVHLYLDSLFIISKLLLGNNIDIFLPSYWSLKSITVYMFTQLWDTILIHTYSPTWDPNERETMPSSNAECVSTCGGMPEKKPISCRTI